MLLRAGITSVVRDPSIESTEHRRDEASRDSSRPTSTATGLASIQPGPSQRGVSAETGRSLATGIRPSEAGLGFAYSSKTNLRLKVLDSSSPVDCMVHGWGWAPARRSSTSCRAVCQSPWRGSRRRVSPHVSSAA